VVLQSFILLLPAGGGRLAPHDQRLVSMEIGWKEFARRHYKFGFLLNCAASVVSPSTTVETHGGQSLRQQPAMSAGAVASTCQA